MTEKIKKEYIKRLKAVLKSKLNSGNTVKAINTWAVPVIRYSAGIVDWKNSAIRNMDRKTRKVLHMYQALHPRSNVDRLYLPCSEGGERSTQLRRMSQCWKEVSGTIPEDERRWMAKKCMGRRLDQRRWRPKIYREKTSKSRMEEWQSKPMHGQFLRQTKDLSSNETCHSFRERNSRQGQKGW